MAKFSGNVSSRKSKKDEKMRWIKIIKEIIQEYSQNQRIQFSRLKWIIYYINEQHDKREKRHISMAGQKTKNGDS